MHKLAATILTISYNFVVNFSLTRITNIFESTVERWIVSMLIRITFAFVHGITFAFCDLLNVKSPRNSSFLLVVSIAWCQWTVKTKWHWFSQRVSNFAVHSATRILDHYFRGVLPTMCSQDNASVHEACPWTVNHPSFKTHSCLPRANLLSLCNRYIWKCISLRCVMRLWLQELMRVQYSPRSKRAVMVIEPGISRCRSASSIYVLWGVVVVKNLIASIENAVYI